MQEVQIKVIQPNEDMFPHTSARELHQELLEHLLTKFKNCTSGNAAPVSYMDSKGNTEVKLQSTLSFLVEAHDVPELVTKKLKEYLRDIVEAYNVQIFIKVDESFVNEITI